MIVGITLLHCIKNLFIVNKDMYITPKSFLGKLVECKAISSVEAEQLEIDSLHQGSPIYEFLLKQGNIKKTDILKVQADFLHVPFIDIS